VDGLVNSDEEVRKLMLDTRSIIYGSLASEAE
jgi:hypothetical protein